MKKYLIAAGLLATLSACSSGPSLLERAIIERKAELEAEKMLAEKEAEAMAEQFSWTYETEEDKMSSETSYFASIVSPDVVNLDFPYEGGSYLSIYLRKTGNESTAFIYISEGQLHTEYDNPTIAVRFGENKAKNFSVSESADNDAQYLFIDNANDFIRELKASKEVLVECMFYNNGSHVFKFNTEGLKWEH